MKMENKKEKKSKINQKHRVQKGGYYSRQGGNYDVILTKINTLEVDNSNDNKNKFNTK